MFKLSTALVLLAAAVSAQVVPTAPYGGESFNEGANCPIQYNLDTTGTWTNMTVDLMTGNNYNMIFVTNVAQGLDGTTGDGTLSWTCPDVTPNSAIYFYQFTNNGIDPTWTTRFTIAAADGSSTEPTNATQPETNAAIPWGTGSLASDASSAGASSTTVSADPSLNATDASSTDASSSAGMITLTSASSTAASRTISTSATSRSSQASKSSTSASASASATGAAGVVKVSEIAVGAVAVALAAVVGL